MQGFFYIFSLMNRITSLFSIQYPLIQAGMVWCSGWRLASAVSESGGLGLIGAGSMTPELLREHISKYRTATNKAFGVNIPLLYTHAEALIEVVIKENVKVVFTSAGNPKLYTTKLKAAGITVVHVVSNTTFALKAQEAGVDAVVAEGVEAGGHNGLDQLTTMCLIPAVCKAVSIPVLAAGGIVSGKSMLAAMALGAEGVQIGSAFAVCKESSAHELYKQFVVNSKEGDNVLLIPQAPVRVLKNKYSEAVQEALSKNVELLTLKKEFIRGKSKLGIFEGDVLNGEIEIGQVAAQLKDIKSAEEIIESIVSEYNDSINKLFVI
jgi:enoyl-[acyl-carrier protein] reductase II